MTNGRDPLPFDWPMIIEANGSTKQPGVYRISIEGVGAYVGRYTNASRPIREYRDNVRKLAYGLAYRKSDPHGFRVIHRELYAALAGKTDITIEIVENVEPDRLNDRERYWIEQIPPDLRLNDRRRPR